MPRPIGWGVFMQSGSKAAKASVDGGSIYEFKALAHGAAAGHCGGSGSR